MLSFSSYPTLSIPLVVALAACGPEVGGGNPLEDHCGQPEPTRLLSLERNQFVPFDRSAIVPYGDRWLVALATLEQDFDGALPRDEAIVDRRVVSVDACGAEDPRPIAQGVDMVFPPSEAGLPWMGCDSSSNQMYIIDPEGELPPSELGTTEHCQLWRTTPGAVWLKRSTDDGDAQLIRISSDEGAAAVETIADGVSPQWRSYDFDEQTLWYLTTDGELREHDLQTREEVLLAEGVGAIVRLSERFLVWGDEPDMWSAGRWTLFDRQTLAATPVEIAGQDQVRFSGSLLFSAVFEARLEDGTNDYLVIRPPSLEPTSFRGQWTLIAETGPGDLVLQSHTPEQHLYVLPIGESEPQLLYASDAALVQVDDDEIWVWDYYDYVVGFSQEHNTRLVRIPLDDREPETIVDEVFQPLALDDGRWLTVRGYAGSARGELRVVDPQGGPEQLVDRDVSVYFRRHNETSSLAPGFGTVPSDAPFLYTVHDGGERDGLWSARLAPAN